MSGTGPQARHVTLTVAAVMFMLMLDSTILNTSLPSIAASQGVPPLTLSSVVTVYLLAAAAVLPLGSWLADRYGLRRVFLVAVALFTLASLLCGAARSPAQLVAARALQGLGGGLLLPTGRTVALRGARKEDILGITALLTWPMLFAPVVGPPLGGVLTTYASWRWCFFLNLPIGLAGLLLVRRLVPADGASQRRPLDWRGAFAAILGLTLLIGGVEAASHAVDADAAGWPALACIAAGVVALAWTARHVRRVDHPIVSLAPFEHRTFTIASTGGVLGSMCIQSTPFLLPLLFQLGLGMNAVASGALLLPYFLGNLGMKSVTTPILKRFGFRRVLLAAGACSSLAIAAFAAVDGATPWAALVALLLVAGCARSMLMTAINTLQYADLPASQVGAGSTLSAITSQVASALGVALGALALAVAARLHGHGRVTLQDFAIAFLAVGLVSGCALLQFRRLGHDAGADVIAARRA